MTSSFDERVLDGLGPAFRDHAGALLPELVAALTGPLAETDRLVQPPTDGNGRQRRWATAFDLQVTPNPGWLAQFTGTQIPPGLTVEQARTYAQDRAGWSRGSLPVLAAAIEAALPEGVRFEIVERAGTAYRLQVRVYDPSGAASDQAVIEAALEEKPVGLRVLDVAHDQPLTYAELGELVATYGDLQDYYGSLADTGQPVPRRWWRTTGASYARLLADHSSYADLAAAFPTYAAMTAHDPTEA